MEQGSMEQGKEAQARKKIIFSGIQPSGNLTIGNYIGAMRNWVAMQQEHDCLYCVVDLHAITVRQDPQALRMRTRQVYALLLAVGLDPAKNTLFVQSHVSAHTELAWVLNCYTYMGELSRMTQFKDKSEKHADNINAGLFGYPVLMASDILLYQADLVPVGADQKQHIELARDVAIRFNNAYSDTFRVPEPYIPPMGARVMSLQEPERKMSKSDDEGSYIAILDEPDVIRKKCRRAVTDSESLIVARPDKPGVSNLITMYGALTGRTMREIEAQFVGKGYGVLKDAVADAIIDTLSPVQAEHKRLMQDKAHLDALMRSGAERAAHRAQRTLDKVYRKIGLLQPGR